MAGCESQGLFGLIYQLSLYIFLDVLSLMTPTPSSFSRRLPGHGEIGGSEAPPRRTGAVDLFRLGDEHVRAVAGDGSGELMRG